MTSTRLSFGSRAGGASDFLSGSNGTSRGPFNAIEDLAESLKVEIEAAQNSVVPDCTTVELHLGLQCPIPLNRPSIGPYAEGGESDLPSHFKTSSTPEDASATSEPFPLASAYSIINVADSRERQIVQRAASRGIIQALEGADGYKYGFNNAWTAKDEEGSRFSYICQDSMQNKDRHANGYTRTLKHLKGEGERGPRKPTYDCKGSISVKFSTTKQRVDVYYRHYAIHATVAERKPPSRPPRRLRPTDEDGTPKETGGLLGALQAESAEARHLTPATSRMHVQSPAIDSPLAPRSQATIVSGSLKRKREWIPPPRPVRYPDAPLSLVELLAQSELANAPAADVDLSRNTRASGVPAPVHYELPSWQAPPPRLDRQPLRREPYPPPYNHQNRQPVSTPVLKAASSQKSQQQSLGTQGQGLYTTMKPVPREWVVHTSYPAGEVGGPTQPIYNSYLPQSRTKTSCTNCRLGKKKCDEQRPRCGACMRNDRKDCHFDGIMPVSQQQQQQQTSSWHNSQNSTNTPAFGIDGSGQKHTPSISRPGSVPQPGSADAISYSPDPWYPKS